MAGNTKIYTCSQRYTQRYTHLAFFTSSIAIVSFFSISYGNPGSLVPYSKQIVGEIKLVNQSTESLKLNIGKKFGHNTNTSSNFL